MMTEFQNRGAAEPVGPARHLTSGRRKAGLLNGAALSLIALLATSANPASAQAVGEVIKRPDTGADQIIAKVLTGQVLTENLVIIYPSLTALTAADVGKTIADPTTAGAPAVKIISVNLSASGLATSIVVEQGGVNRTVLTYVDKAADAAAEDASIPLLSGGGGGGVVPLATGVDDINAVTDGVQQGASGANGRDGGGINLGAFILGRSAGNGTEGANGPSFSRTIDLSHGRIETHSDELAGVTIGSIGGAGGTGGSSYVSLGVPGGNGGKAGLGGNVTGINYVDVTTYGDSAHGVFVYSSSGNGGGAGAAYGIAAGGDGGEGNGGGAATGTNYGVIETVGDGSVGLLVSSLGGASGGAGGSYGIVGIPGNALQAGAGGAATANNYGSIATWGQGSHGVSATSTGGTGGNAGGSFGVLALGNSSTGTGGAGGSATATNGSGGRIVTHGTDAFGLLAQSVGGGGGDGAWAVGLVAIGSTGAAAGAGGSATARQTDGGAITTYGDGSFGIFAQSIGGGGGNGGVGGGIVGIGGAGAGGGNAGVVLVETDADTSIRTAGAFAHGIFAESVGKGGGAGGVGAGAVGVGGSGSGGGLGGDVTVNNDGSIVTGGAAARGIFAHSVGGGGGSAHATGGIVAVGGSAGGAGGAGAVRVTNNGAITTLGGDADDAEGERVGSDGIFVQSIGGGGGSGSPSGGLVALGGDGGSGGDGGLVTVINTGVVHTGGSRARGIFAQSVGGGGGTGGEAGAAFAIGGDGGVGGNAIISDGGAVTVNNSGAIVTTGNVASGIQAQSTGGGGGDGGTTGGLFLVIGGGGNTGGAAGEVTVTNSANIRTGGDDSHGIFVQSTGGGGGNGADTVSISAFVGVGIGGAGGEGGDGGLAQVFLEDSYIDFGDGVSVPVSPLIVTVGDRSRGVFVESVGGGGGNGGFAVQVSGGYLFSASIAIGGSAGGGGLGGRAVLDGDATVRTEGDSSEGMFVQSVGGGGGSGGFAVAVSIAGGDSGALAVSVGIGGSGGDGGAGGEVAMNSGGAIVTEGTFSTGLVAQSVGGGGGTGGFSVSVAAAAAAETAGAVSVGVGGSGGKGGDGGVVNATFNGDITTTGQSAKGALIQSVGGGGGNGGFNVSASVALSGEASGAVSVGVGGSGGDGGAGGAVHGEVNGAISTGRGAAAGTLTQVVLVTGLETPTCDEEVEQVCTAKGVQQSSGLVVQSVGGGGGDGAFNVSGSIAGSTEGAVGIGVGVGGSGGGGGNGGTVFASSRSITTTAAQSAGLIAQSVGGGGGNGGMNVSGSIAAALNPGLAVGISVGVGGSGGGGGSGARVDARVLGDVTTQGDQSDGVIAQSVGGGGGTGGMNVSGAISFSEGVAASIGVGVGGAGGGGGDSGEVYLTINGATRTGFVTVDSAGNVLGHYGDDSDAITAQSVGGGGGTGGLNVTGNIAFSSDLAAGTIGVGVGGSGGDGGNASHVDLRINEFIANPDHALLAVSTMGANAHGVLAQSIGGGGGGGGVNVTLGLALAVEGSGNIGVGVGGSGGKGGNAGSVFGLVNGDVLTREDGSYGVLVQSAGGGGGDGAFNISGGVALSFGVSGNILVGVGGLGGDGGDGAEVGGGVNGDIRTGYATLVDGVTQVSGHNAYGLTYQSLGGGGGNGEFNITGGLTGSLDPEGGSGTLGVGVGGWAGNGGNASAVNASFDGSIVTWGDSAYGALLQSAGGGGGNGGFNVTGSVSLSSGIAGALGFGIGGFGGGGGDSVALAGQTYVVTGVLNGDVTTHGDSAYGAMLQSIGGGGGNGGMNITGNLSATVNAKASVAIGVGIGGFGGQGGDAGGVSGVVTGDYVTNGVNSAGVTAQSIGGGGGNGGLNLSGSVALGVGTAGSGSVGIGGFGADAGNAGDVRLVRTGDTTTLGDNSYGVMAQSVGGGGGAGAVNISGGLTASTTGSAASLGFGLGGFGGGGGAAGNVDLSVTGNVWARGIVHQVAVALTPEECEDPANKFLCRPPPCVEDEIANPDGACEGSGASGIIAQSVGGGGGVGGLNFTAEASISLAGGAKSGRALAIGIGGFGGAGGDAGDVVLNVQAPVPADANDLARIQVQGSGDNRSAIIAQSIGGGGGVGGLNFAGGFAANGTAAIGIGGFGSDGGLGGDVTVNADADLFANGNTARGLLAQSIGGGGGSGGINISGAGTVSTESSLAFGLGGYGGDGNRSGDVSVAHTGQVVVDGQNAIGLLVQSVAGGGGDGALNVAFDVNFASSQTTTNPLKGYGIAVGIGGSGGDGADAGDVTLVNNGNIFINGSSPARQPVVETDIDKLLAADFEETGWIDLAKLSHAIVVQSIGGGGGTGAVNLTAALTPFGNPIAIGVGGSGGSGGDAGTVTVTRGYMADGVTRLTTPGLLRTEGDSSVAFIAQSIGGGGGDAGVNINIGVTLKGKEGGVKDGTVALLLNVGGDGGGSGSGEAVTVRHNGDILTGEVITDAAGLKTYKGDRSAGLLAQSIGGGGGQAAYNIGFGVLAGASALELAVGGAPGAAGSAGAVDVVHNGSIVTYGADAGAIIAQSIGGGGGNVATNTARSLLAKQEVKLSIGRDGGEGGEGGDVRVDVNLNNPDSILSTRGDRSSGVLAQSIGGGGGNSGSTSAGYTKASSQNAGSSDTSSSIKVGVGLGGAQGAIAQNVDVNIGGWVVTEGQGSHGVLAQSIGGGGGNAGSVMTDVKRSAYSANIAVGGSGGAGGTPGEVRIVSSANIQTRGGVPHEDALAVTGSYGLFAQSIGGGGGNGGDVTVYSTAAGGPTSTNQAARNLTVLVGGSGGTGQFGNLVDVRNSGVIVTSGYGSYGIRAQSIGGGGGGGGTAMSARLDSARGTSQTAAILVGGSGDEGGYGGRAYVLNQGSIYTEGALAAGIAASSIGGGGGDAGQIYDLAIGSLAASGTYQKLSINIGGSGGQGGAGGAVDVNNERIAGVAGSGQIVTLGASAYGVFAQSLGGGGGNGTSIFSVSGAVGSKKSFTAGLNIGGSGDTGGTGGAVTVTNSGLIDTTGANAHGVLAQSVGGGGGNGGMVIAGSLVWGAPKDTPIIAVGGLGGDGGDGGNVTVTNSGRIVTRGAGADGIVAQSIGGGGGNANMGLSLSGNPITLLASNAYSALLGAFGGSSSGGLGGEVTVTNTGDITVLGAGSTAIRAESINGGGGSLTVDFSAITGLGDECVLIPLLETCLPGTGETASGRDPVVLMTAKAGSSDSQFMNAGKVHVTGTGNVGAGGADSAGIAMQAIGGGGGETRLNALLATIPDPVAPSGARTALASALPPATTRQPPLDILSALGATDGSNNAGGAIDGAHTGDILTTGLRSPGLLLQSIGGGGGRSVVVLTAPAQTTLRNVDLVLGGVNNSASPGQTIDRTQSGSVVSTGNFSPAVLLQSLGGGGGLASAGIDAVDQSRLVVRPVLGADGGVGLGGAAINGTFSGGIYTFGDHSAALMAQSIGAGGGAALISGSVKVQATLGGRSGATGDGQSITIANTGAVATTGLGAHGVMLQSIGGGGGAVLSDGAMVSVTTSDANSGDGGDIRLGQVGDVLTSGNGSYGLIIQSLGGGGGWVEGRFAGSAGGFGRGGIIDVTIDGRVLATGSDSTAIFAQSLGSSGGDDISILLNSAIRGGSGFGRGLSLDGGATNRITTSGSLSSVSTWALTATWGDDAVVNQGLVVGNIALGGGLNSFDNRAGATFIAYSTIDMRGAMKIPAAAAKLALVSPAPLRADLSPERMSGPAQIPYDPDPAEIVTEETLTFASDFADASPARATASLKSTLLAAPVIGAGVFSNSGDFLMGLSASRLPIDLLNGDVFGNFDDLGDPTTNLLFGARVINGVTLNGDFVQTSTGHMAFDVAYGPYASDQVRVSGTASVAGTGYVTLTWLESADPVTLFAASGGGVDHGLKITDTMAVDFSIAGDGAGIHLLIDTHFGLSTLNRNGRALGDHMDSAVLQGGSAGIGRLMALLGNMPESDRTLYTQVMTQLSPEPHLAPLQGQMMTAGDFAHDLFDCGSAVRSRDNSCAWTRVESSRRVHASSFENFGFEGESTRLGGGFQRPAGENWSLAGAVAYEQIDKVRVDVTRSGSSGQGFSAGLGLERETGAATTYGVSLTGGWSWLDTWRAVTVFEPGIGKSSPEMGYLRLDAHAGRAFRKGDFFVKPTVDLALTALHHGGLVEDGLDGIGVEVLSDTQYLASANPKLVLGYIGDDRPGRQNVVSLTLGARLNSANRIELPIRFIGANSSANPATIGLEMDRVVYQVGVDVNLMGDERYDLRLGYAAEFGKNDESQRASFNFRVRF